jgi:acetyl-CoA carboxylase biotin carboxyl carrier protein
LNFKEILELIDKVADRGISAIEIEQAGTKVRIEGMPVAQQTLLSSLVQGLTIQGLTAQGQTAGERTISYIPANTLPPASGAPKAEEKKPAAEADPSLHTLTSPIVGTFYRQAGPESPAFVEAGSRVKKGQVLCIVEAMKLMNEIESDVDGTIVEIYPQNAQPIEYGEPLFSIKV